MSGKPKLVVVGKATVEKEKEEAKLPLFLRILATPFLLIRGIAVAAAIAGLYAVGWILVGLGLGLVGFIIWALLTDGGV